MLPGQTVRLQERGRRGDLQVCSSPCRRDGRALCPIPCPPTTQSQVRRRNQKRKYPVCDFTSPHPGVNTAMMSQFCSKFWGLLSPTHSDSSQGGQESGGVQEMGGEQKLAPHSGRKTGTRGHTVYRVDCIRIIPHHTTPCLCLSLLMSLSSFHLSFSKLCLFSISFSLHPHSTLNWKLRRDFIRRTKVCTNLCFPSRNENSN